MCKHHSTVLSECEVTSVEQVTDKHVYAITTTNQCADSVKHPVYSGYHVSTYMFEK